MTQIGLRTWARTLDNLNIDVDGEYEATYYVAREQSAELLAVLMYLNRHGLVTTSAQRNPFNLRSTGSFSGVIYFPTYASAFEEALRQYIIPNFEAAPQQYLDDLQAIIDSDTYLADAPPEHPAPANTWEPRYPELRAWYGTLERYDDSHPVAALWFAIGSMTGVWPSLSMINDDDPERQLWSFSNGLRVVWDGTDSAAQVIHVQRPQPV